MIILRQKYSQIILEMELSNQDLMAIRQFVKYGMEKYSDIEKQIHPAISSGCDFLRLTAKYVMPD